MFNRLEIFVLSTFAKNDPLIVKTSGGFIIWGGRSFLLGEGISNNASLFIAAPVLLSLLLLLVRVPGRAQ